MLQAKVILANLCLFIFLLSNVREIIGIKVELLTVYKTSDGVAIENGRITVITDSDVQLLLLGEEVENKKISFAHTAPKNASEPCDDYRITGTFQTDSKGLVTLNFKVNICSYVLLFCFLVVFVLLCCVG